LAAVLEPEGSIPCEFVIQVRVSCPDYSAGAADLKARVSNEVLGLLVDLEYRLGDPTTLRPYLRPSRESDWFVWHVGVNLAEPKALKSWCDRKATELKSSLSLATSATNVVDVSLVLVDR
jgi:hypothetical protein